MAAKLPYPLFDADSQLHETQESLTKYLPRQHQHAVQYVAVKGRTNANAIRGQISNNLPNPTFEVVTRTGALEKYFKHGNPMAKPPRGVRETIRSIPTKRRPSTLAPHSMGSH